MRSMRTWGRRRRRHQSRASGGRPAPAPARSSSRPPWRGLPSMPGAGCSSQASLLLQQLPPVGAQCGLQIGVNPIHLQVLCSGDYRIITSHLCTTIYRDYLEEESEDEDKETREGPGFQVKPWLAIMQTPVLRAHHI